MIQYAILTKLIAINNNEISHVKGKEFLFTINIHKCRELMESNTKLYRHSYNSLEKVLVITNNSWGIYELRRKGGKQFRIIANRVLIYMGHSTGDLQLKHFFT